jgi:lysozyme
MNIKGIYISFAFIKATEGTDYKDSRFDYNWKESQKAGIMRGAYHYFLPHKDIEEQIAFFKKNVKLEKGDLPPVLDVEITGGLSPTALRKNIKIWMKAMEKHYNVRPILYTYKSFYIQHLNTAEFKEFPLWVAHYYQRDISMPNGRRWSFWQHTDKGSVNGIDAPVDFNVFQGDSIALSRFCVR